MTSKLLLLPGNRKVAISKLSTSKARDLEQEVPKSLCVYEDAFAETGFKWSPVRFIEDVRTWLARTARGDLHQPGQPLEPLMEAGTPELIIPNGLLKDLKPYEYLFLKHGM